MGDTCESAETFVPVGILRSASSSVLIHLLESRVHVIIVDNYEFSKRGVSGYDGISTYKVPICH